MPPTLLDGPMGTELHRRGHATTLPLWSAGALLDAPELVSAVHADYATAGATVHSTNTFRTKRRTCPDDWETLARRAVELCRAAIPAAHRVAGSIAPLEDCYRPDLSPEDPRPEHRELCQLLAEAGCDLLLCETFPHVGEGLVALEEAVATGVESWIAFTAGPEATLMTPEEMASAAGRARERGAAAVLVNCVPATQTLAYVRALSDVGLPFGAYANAGAPDDAMGWRSDPDFGAERYAALAATWVDAGATLLGGCCGTGPAHIAALHTKMDCR